jgi:hypothetical protein
VGLALRQFDIHPSFDSKMLGSQFQQVNDLKIP